MEDQELLEGLKSAIASVEMEGYTFTDEEKELLLRDAKGEMSHSEFEKAVLALIKKE